MASAGTICQARLFYTAAYSPIRPSVSFIQGGICGTERIAVRADEPEIRLCIIPPVPIDVISGKGYDPALRIHFRPSAQAALISVFLPKVPLYMKRNDAERNQAALLPLLPSLDIGDVLVLHLADIAAIAMPSTRGFLSALEACSSWRSWHRHHVQ